jgi:hypothetical protein
MNDVEKEENFLKLAGSKVTKRPESSLLVLDFFKGNSERQFVRDSVKLSRLTWLRSFS